MLTLFYSFKRLEAAGLRERFTARSPERRKNRKTNLTDD